MRGPCPRQTGHVHKASRVSFHQVQSRSAPWISRSFSIANPGSAQVNKKPARTVVHLPTPKNLSIYVHWPYCAKICPYCDFNRYVSKSIDHKKMLSSYLKELDVFLDMAGGDRTLHSVFFGGGTPSLALPETFEAILVRLRERLPWSPDAEITMEANPTSVEASKLREFRAAGINRISLGVQSLIAEDLKYLGRNHSATEARDAIQLASSLFPRVSFDLIYGRSAQQSPESWRSELKDALALGTSHISLYNLTLEPGTKFHALYNNANSALHDAKVTLPHPEVAAQLYEVTVAEAEATGLKQYEVSNFAKEGQECRHNLNYWSNGDFVGIGPGAAGRLTIDGKRRSFMQPKAPEKWTAVAATGRGTSDEQILSDEDNLQELLICTLRSRQGLSSALLKTFTGRDKFEEALYAPKLRAFVEEGLLELSSEHMRATPRGLMFIDTILPAILPRK